MAVPDFRHDFRYCPECRDEQPFGQPPCADGHDPDCPEWACLTCGAALLVGLPAPVPAVEGVAAA